MASTSNSVVTGIGGGADAIPKIFTEGDYSNTGDNSNITTITEFTTALLANSTYEFKMWLHLYSVAQAVARIKPSYPADVSEVWFGVGGPQSSGNAQLIINPSNGTQLGQLISTQPGGYDKFLIVMTVKTGASDGEFSFGFSGANGATATTFKAGSYMQYEKIA